MQWNNNGITVSMETEVVVREYRDGGRNLRSMPCTYTSVRVEIGTWIADDLSSLLRLKAVCQLFARGRLGPLAPVHITNSSGETIECYPYKVGEHVQLALLYEGSDGGALARLDAVDVIECEHALSKAIGSMQEQPAFQFVPAR